MVQSNRRCKSSLISSGCLFTLALLAGPAASELAPQELPFCSAFQSTVAPLPAAPEYPDSPRTKRTDYRLFCGVRVFQCWLGLFQESPHLSLPTL